MVKAFIAMDIQKSVFVCKHRMLPKNFWLSRY